jgi:DMSO reductase anchor subunit
MPFWLLSFAENATSLATAWILSMTHLGTHTRSTHACLNRFAMAAISRVAVAPLYAGFPAGQGTGVTLNRGRGGFADCLAARNEA